MTTPPPTLADLRREIDRIDEAMHRLLMERGEIIDTLIATKKTAESGSAFRPAREADMMKRLVERHRGISAARHRGEHLARHHRDLHLCAGAVLAACRPLGRRGGDARYARFHFGFTVPFATHMGAAGVVGAIAASRGDLGLVPATGASGAWWTALEGGDAPKIIARLPFVERADHPAGLQVFAIARPNPTRW
jgi:chorismate mutase